MANQTYKCKQCPKRFTLNDDGSCTEKQSAKPVEPVKPVKSSGSNVGKAIMRINGIFGAMAIGALLMGFHNQPISQELKPAVAIAKPVHHTRHVAHKKSHHKKCKCDCKKVVDTAAKPV